MPTAPPLSYANLPTFSAVIDGLASGLGIARNNEDALSGLGSFSRRIDAYSGRPNRPGLRDRILELLAGPHEKLRHCLDTRLLDAETELTNARAVPLVTEAPEVEGLKRFIEIFVAPWIAQALTDSAQYPGSVLDSARKLIEQQAAFLNDANTNYLASWKADVRRAIPEGANAREFRSMLAKLDQRSQRKHSSIEQDLANLRNEMQVSFSSVQELDAVVEDVRTVYLAGMATMRLCTMVEDIIPNNDLLLNISKLLVKSDSSEDASEKRKITRRNKYWTYLDPSLTLSKQYDILCHQLSDLSQVNFDNLCADSRASLPSKLLSYVIDYAEGRWHLAHGRNESAEQYFKAVVAQSEGRQLGELAAESASILTALRLSDPAPLKFEVLNRLLRVRIDNMQQLTEMCIDHTPTPFSDWSPRPEPSFYDLHLMQSVAFFNEISCPPGEFAICSPSQRFDKNVENLIMKSRKVGARLSEEERKRPAIIGTSIKAYYFLRDHLYYRDKLFGWNLADLPGMDVYAMLSGPDKLRVLRYVDAEQFQSDVQAHGLDPWRHPDDLS